MNEIFKQKRETFDLLRRFTPKTVAAEQCELCGLVVGSLHRHLLDLKTRSILCACQACGILFSNESGQRYKRIPETTKGLDDFRLTDAQWESLAIPISLAFFFRDSVAEKFVAFYPSPAGPTESLLDLSSWQEIVDENAAVAAMQADVEALLINRVKTAREYYITPIDECYRLVGIIRLNWRGLSGGTEAWKSIDQFFAGLRDKASATQLPRSVRAKSGLTNAAA